MFIQPFETKKQNYLESFYTLMSVLLMSSCIIYTQERGEVKKETLENAMDFFIYTFMAMMVLIVIQLLSEFFVDLYQKRKGAKTEEKKEEIEVKTQKSMKGNEKSERELIQSEEVSFASLAKSS